MEITFCSDLYGAVKRFNLTQGGGTVTEEGGVSAGVLALCTHHRQQAWGGVGEETELLLVHSRDGGMLLLDAERLTRRASRVVGTGSFFRMQTTQYRGQQLAVLPSRTDPSRLDLWDLDTGDTVVVAIGIDSEKTGNAMCGTFCGTAQLELLVGFDDGTVRGFSIDPAGETFAVMPERRLKVFPMTVTCLAYDRGRDSLVVGGPGPDLVLVRHWMRTGCSSVICRRRISNEGVAEVCFSPSGRLVVTGGWDGKYGE